MLKQLARLPWRETLFLCLLSLMIYGIGAFEPSLFEDEWYHIREMAMDATKCPSDSLFFRPLTGCYYEFLRSLFGINVRGFHFFLFLLRTLNALVFYAFLLRAMSSWRDYALAVAAVFLVFPTVFMWPMFALGHIYLAYLMCFCGCYMLLVFASRRSWFYWVIGLCLFIASLLLYEAVVGLMTLVSVLLLIRYHRAPLRRLVGIAGPIVLATLFSWGRWMTQLQVASAFGHDTEQVLEQMTPRALLARLVRGYWINLGRSGLDSLYDIFDTVHQFPYRQMWFWGVAIGIVLMLVGCFMVRNRSRIGLYMRDPKHLVDTPMNIPSNNRDLCLLLLVGLLTIGAGYFPSILVVDPGMHYGGSRINYLPSAGASIFIVSIMILFTKFLTLVIGGRPRFMLFVLVMLFVILAGRVHIHAQLETIESWHIQKHFWNELFSAVPDLQPDTQLILALPATYTRSIKFGAPPFAIYWKAFGGAFALFYGYDTPMDVNVIYGAGTEAILEKDGNLYIPSHLQQPTPVPIPPDRTLILIFDERTAQIGSS